MNKKSSLVIIGIIAVIIAGLVPKLIPLIISNDLSNMVSWIIALAATLAGLIIIIAACVSYKPSSENTAPATPSDTAASSNTAEDDAISEDATTPSDTESESYDNNNPAMQTARISEGIQNIALIVDELAASIEKTVTFIDDVNNVAEQMDSAFTDMQQSAKDNSDYMEEISQKALHVRLSSLDTKKEVMDMATKVEESMAEKIEASKAVRQIEDLTNDILEISDQTNLLALNASIEAAHAGDSGRGFAVVADEITKLADSTSKTAKQIQDISKLVIDKVDELAAESNRVIDFLNSKTTSGYDKLVETSNDYQNDSKIMFDMMQDFAGAILLLEENMSQIIESLASITADSQNSIQQISVVSESSYDALSQVSELSSNF